MIAIQHSSEGSDHNTGGKKDAAGHKLGGEFGIAAVMAVIAAILVELLSWFLKRYGVFVETPTWLLASLSFTIGVFLIVQVIRGFSAGRLWFAVSAFLISIVLFVIAVPSTRSFDIVEYSSIDWRKLMEHAETEVLAEGSVLDGMDIDVLIRSLRRSERLRVQLVLLDPEGTAVIQRSMDENPKAPHDNPARIREKIRGFQVARSDPESRSWRDRFQLLVRNTYPTMAVIVVDDELYAYLYSFRQIGTQSPVFKFPNYKQSGLLGNFFEGQLRRSLDPNQGAYPPQDYTTPAKH